MKRTRDVVTKLKGIIKSGNVCSLGVSLTWKIERARSRGQAFDTRSFGYPYCLHLGPGPNWVKPNNYWINVDIDPEWGDMVVDFQEFVGFPLETGTAECIYGSHVFEHMSIWVTDTVFSECYRLLQPGGYFRLVLPDAEKSIREYLAQNADFSLFRRRRERAKTNYGLDYTLFDCLREDFLSRTGQEHLLGKRALAHQNAWDFESISRDLERAGFSDIYRSALKSSKCRRFDFEGSYECEALEEGRSLYVEAIK